MEEPTEREMREDQERMERYIDENLSKRDEFYCCGYFAQALSIGVITASDNAYRIYAKDGDNCHDIKRCPWCGDVLRTDLFRVVG